ncbi:MAG: hypothetical protein ABI333_28815 [bacterium]
MTRNVSVLSDFVFPALLMGCGCLGLVVINLISVQRSRPADRAQQPGRVPTGASRPGAKEAPPQPPSGGMRALPRVTVAPPPMGGAGVALLERPAPGPLRISLGFSRRRLQLSEEEQGRLSRFIAQKPLGRKTVSVQGYGADEKSVRRARRRVRRVVGVLKRLGVPAERIAIPAVARVGPSGRVDVVTVVIGHR